MRLLRPCSIGFLCSFSLANCGAAPAPEPQIVRQWHTLELDFEGPQTSETADKNPFLNYRLDVTFERADTRFQVQGFYAADGEAADTSAIAGNIWRVRFTPDQTGDWRYTAVLRTGKEIALEPDQNKGETLPLQNNTGTFSVLPTDKSVPDFRATGRLVIEDGEYRHGVAGRLWRKGGANSPENLLGYVGFDDTRRLATEARQGEANATEAPLHAFEPHIPDWQQNDPLWGADRHGKGLIGAINYLASKGMNAVYFLTLNIGGDGNDVWPYASPNDKTRFDVSKLAQWNQVLAHMQAKGIALHLVVQETENELWLDGGDTGRDRQLYFNELIARFGHHPGLMWNLGEENGPAHWRPEGQTTAQRMAMATYLKENDPYNHPVLLHTHSSAEDKDALLTPLLGFDAIDGLSLQVDDPLNVHGETSKWRKLSEDAGHVWAITMDEIGHWSTGAVPDADDPDHDHLRRHALWGSLMAGASGVEWYFGAHYPANDLTSEDWRLRENLWQQTFVAIEILQKYFADTGLTPCPQTYATGAVYCALTDDNLSLLYVEANTPAPTLMHIPKSTGHKAIWIAPKTGNTLPEQGLPVSEASTVSEQLSPPDPTQDWLVLIKPEDQVDIQK